MDHCDGLATHPRGSRKEQGWRSGESARLPPMCPGFDSHTWGPFLEAPGNYRAR